MSKDFYAAQRAVENAVQNDPGLLAKIQRDHEARKKNSPTVQPKVTPKPALQLVSVGEMLKKPEVKVRWLLEDILPAGGLGLIVAKPKVGKSTCARCLALAVAKGEVFLGRATERGAVLYLALEEKESEVISHFRAMGATGEEPVFIHCAHASDGALIELRLLAEKHKPALIIIDPLMKMVRVKDANAYAEVTAALEPLLILARETGAHVLVTHHSGKSERPEAMDSILGSTAIFGSVDTAIVMKKSERYRTVQSVQRYGPDLLETVVEFDPDTQRVTLGAEKSEVEQGRIGAAILEYLNSRTEPLTEKEILADVEGRQKTKWLALRDLHAAGKVSRSGSGKRGKPFLYELSGISISPTPIYPGSRVGETINPFHETETKAEKVLPDVRAGNGSPGYRKSDSPVGEIFSLEEPDYGEV